MLRTALGLPADQKHISFSTWAGRSSPIPSTGEKSLFLLQVRGLPVDKPAKRGSLEAKVLELSGRYEAYQALRRGETLLVLPLPGSTSQEWISVARLIGTDWDVKTDPTGQIRRAQAELKRRGRPFWPMRPTISTRPPRPSSAAVRGPAPNWATIPRPDHRSGSGVQPLGPVPYRRVCLLLALPGIVARRGLAAAAVLGRALGSTSRAPWSWWPASASAGCFPGTCR